MWKCIFILAFMYLSVECYDDCNVTEWRKMTMEEILYKSDIVVYGRDTMHMKLRHPDALDSRFRVFCLLKHDTFIIPGEIIIEDVDEYIECYPVMNQTKVGKDYIIGLSRETSGFTKYSAVNMMQKSAFEPTPDNFAKMAKICELNKWIEPVNGFFGKCPTNIQIPKECRSLKPVKKQPKEKSWWGILFGLSGGAVTKAPNNLVWTTLLSLQVFILFYL